MWKNRDSTWENSDLTWENIDLTCEHLFERREFSGFTIQLKEEPMRAH